MDPFVFRAFSRPGQDSLLKRSPRFLVWFLLAAALRASCDPCAPAEPLGRGTNLALHARYECVPAPNYWGWKFPQHGDKGQLTDGKIVETWATPQGEIYSLSSSVGWYQKGPVVIFDLGETREIGGVGMHTVLSQWGPYWPQFTTVLVSDDNQNFYPVGVTEEAVVPERLDPPLTPEKVQASLDRVLDKKGYEPTTHWYRTRPFAARGRYVALIMMLPPGTGAIVVDEVEIYGATYTVASYARPAQVFREGKGGWESFRLFRAIRDRLSRDIAVLRIKINESSIAPRTRENLLERLRQLEARSAEHPVPSVDGFRAVLPISDLEREIFKVQAALWRAQKVPSLRVWHSHRWDPLPPWEQPRGENPALAIVMTENEVRSDVLNLSNATDTDCIVHLDFSSLPAERLEVFEIQTVDTYEMQPVAAAMLPAEKQKGTHLIHVPAGMTRQVWLRCSSRSLASAKYSGEIRLRSGTAKRFKASVPMSIQVVPVRLPERFSLRIGGWDYAINRHYDVTEGNVEEFVAVLKEYGVNNVAWAAVDAVMPAGQFDVASNLVSSPPRRGMEEWLKLWPNVDMYCVFGVGISTDDPKRARKAAVWAKDWADYLNGRGVPTKKLAILLSDEPTTEPELQYILEMGRAIKQAVPEIKIWNDIHYGNPNQAPPVLDQVMRETCDVQCFNVQHFLMEPQVHAAFMEKHLRPGLEWWCYTGNDDRLTDPYVSCLLRSWFCFANGLIGPHWQMFGDGNGGFSWNEYFNNGASRTPLYLARDSVTTAKYMEALREGAQDYELLLLLRNELSRRGGESNARVTQARQVLDEGVRDVLSAHDLALWKWRTPKDRSTADRVRERILRVLLQLDSSKQ